jgi:hypothetical protein
MAFPRDRAETAIDWRVIEPALIDTLRRRGCRFEYGSGLAYLVAEFYDDTTGQLLRRQRVVNLEDIARDLADALPAERSGSDE